MNELIIHLWQEFCKHDRLHIHGNRALLHNVGDVGDVLFSKGSRQAVCVLCGSTRQVLHIFGFELELQRGDP